MRRTLILIASLGLAGCPETASERQARDELQRIAEEREREQAAAEQEAAEHLMTFGLVGTETEAAAGDLGAPRASGRAVAGRDASCAGMADAEAFVRCLYAGIGEGWLNTREAPDGPAVMTDRIWSIGEQVRAAAPNWEQIEVLCLCETPTQVRLRSVTITPGAGGTAVAQLELSGTQNERPSLDLVLENGAWQVNEVRHAM